MAEAALSIIIGDAKRPHKQSLRTFCLVSLLLFTFLSEDWTCQTYYMLLCCVCSCVYVWCMFIITTH